MTGKDGAFGRQSSQVGCLLSNNQQFHLLLHFEMEAASRKFKYPVKKFLI